MTPTAPSPAARPSLVYAWWVVLVLMVCYTLSFIDRQILSLLVRPIKSDLHVSDTQIGLLQGLAFAVFYTLWGIPIGRVADRHSRRNLISAGVLLWSVFTASCSAAGSFATLFLARMGVGVGEATLSPAAFSLISDCFPRERLGRALSVYSMGVYLGSGLALIVGGVVIDIVTTWPAMHVPMIGLIAPWRFTFFVVGAPGVVVALLVSSLREPLRHGLKQNAGGQAVRLGAAEVVAEIRQRWRSVAAVAFGTAGQAMGTYGFMAWAPTFFLRVYGWTPGQTGRALGAVVLVAGMAGMYVGGYLCDRWQQAGIREAPLKVGSLAGVATAVVFAAALFASTPFMTLLIIAPGLFFLAMPLGPSFASLQLIFPNQVRGQVSALFIFINSLCGLTLGPLLPGALNDYVFKSEKMVGVSLLLTMVVAGIAMAALYGSAYGPYRRDHARMNPLV
jgi:MFS family permease